MQENAKNEFKVVMFTARFVDSVMPNSRSFTSTFVHVDDCTKNIQKKKKKSDRKVDTNFSVEPYN